MSKHKWKMKRYRIMDKGSGTTFELSAFTLTHACDKLGLREEGFYWIEIPAKRTGDPIKRYVAPITH